MSPHADLRVAVVDVGSNSTRLLLCEGLDAEGPRGERRTVITGLRRGAGMDGAIAPDALARLDACLAGYGAAIAAFAPGRVLAIGTSAVRDAPNRDAVAALVEARLGAPLRVASGEEEAALAFAGARLALPGDGRPALVLDVGGGSTELVRGGPDGPEAMVSLQVGSVRCSERLRADPPAPGELRALRAGLERELGPHARRLGAGAAVIGVAGTVTTLAAIRQGAYDPARVHRARLALQEVERIAARLAALPLARRRAVAGLHPDRAPAIVAGAQIVLAALAATAADGLLVSERDLLDGAVLAAAGIGADAAARLGRAA
ncbi:MAG: exopolyphosphatase / guanosine-5-triphosphate,3-diphosphate pyrophosphatase [Miltoncostaeaceae bacterium]|nr:exopolyphosphatase / guanosine-5-triphosphate,3-diphosphate pyrophosphatase [Miltoncostaeaceae bacterium]